LKSSFIENKTFAIINWNTYQLYASRNQTDSLESGSQTQVNFWDHSHNQ